MAHRNRWFTVLNSMVIFHGKLLNKQMVQFAKLNMGHGNSWSAELFQMVIFHSELLVYQRVNTNKLNKEKVLVCSCPFAWHARPSVSRHKAMKKKRVLFPCFEVCTPFRVEKLRGSNVLRKWRLFTSPLTVTWGSAWINYFFAGGNPSISHPAFDPYGMRSTIQAD